MSKKFPYLEMLISGEPLWDERATLRRRVRAMMEAHNGIEREWREHLEDDNSCYINTGVLLGAMNLIEGLMDTITEGLYVEEG